MLSQHIGKLVYSCRPASLSERRNIQIFMLALKWLSIYLTLFCSAYTHQHPISAGGRSLCASALFLHLSAIWCAHFDAQYISLLDLHLFYCIIGRFM